MRCYLTLVLLVLLALATERSAFAQKGVLSSVIVEVEAEYLTLWTNASTIPSLVSTSPPGTARGSAGVLGTPGAETIFGGGGFDSGDRPGGRISGKILFTENTQLVFSTMFSGEDPGSNFSAFSDGSSILSRPYLDAQTMLEDAELVAFPSVLEGSINVSGSSAFTLADAAVEFLLLDDQAFKAFGHAGYRFLEYEDGVSIREDLRSIELGGVVPLNTEFIVSDEFDAKNSFHGAVLGIGVSRVYNDFELELFGSASLGSLRRELSVLGQTDVTVPTLPTTTTTGGLLAQPTNIGSQVSSRFVAIPEARAKLKRNLTDTVSLDVGYTFMLLPQTWRASEQIDRVVNASQLGGGALSGAANPAVVLAERDTWLQALSFGVTLTR